MVSLCVGFSQECNTHLLPICIGALCCLPPSLPPSCVAVCFRKMSLISSLTHSRASVVCMEIQAVLCDTSLAYKSSESAGPQIHCLLFTTSLCYQQKRSKLLLQSLKLKFSVQAVCTVRKKKKKRLLETFTTDVSLKKTILLRPRVCC